MPLRRRPFGGLRDNGPGQLHQLSDALHALFGEVVREVALRGAVGVHAPAVYRDGDFLRGDLLHPKGSACVEIVLERPVVERLVMLVGAVVEDADNLAGDICAVDGRNVPVLPLLVQLPHIVVVEPDG